MPMRMRMRMPMPGSPCHRVVTPPVEAESGLPWCSRGVAWLAGIRKGVRWRPRGDSGEVRSRGDSGEVDAGGEDEASVERRPSRVTDIALALLFVVADVMALAGVALMMFVSGLGTCTRRGSGAASRRRVTVSRTSGRRSSGSFPRRRRCPASSTRVCGCRSPPSSRACSVSPERCWPSGGRACCCRSPDLETDFTRHRSVALPHPVPPFEPTTGTRGQHAA